MLRSRRTSRANTSATPFKLDGMCERSPRGYWNPGFGPGVDGGGGAPYPPPAGVCDRGGTRACGGPGMLCGVGGIPMPCDTPRDGMLGMLCPANWLGGPVTCARRGRPGADGVCAATACTQACPRWLERCSHISYAAEALSCSGRGSCHRSPLPEPGAYGAAATGVSTATAPWTPERSAS